MYIYISTLYTTCTIYTLCIYIQGYYLNFLDIYKLLMVKKPMILLYLVIYCCYLVL